MNFNNLWWRETSSPHNCSAKCTPAILGYYSWSWYMHLSEMSSVIISSDCEVTCTYYFHKLYVPMQYTLCNPPLSHLRRPSQQNLLLRYSEKFLGKDVRIMNWDICVTEKLELGVFHPCMTIIGSKQMLSSVCRMCASMPVCRAVWSR